MWVQQGGTSPPRSLIRSNRRLINCHFTTSEAGRRASVMLRGSVPAKGAIEKRLRHFRRPMDLHLAWNTGSSKSGDEQLGDEVCWEQWLV